LEKTMAQLLEHDLNRKFASPGHPIEVLNFAQGGATLAQEYLILRNRVWAFHPQIVIFFVDSVTTSSRKLWPSDSAPFYVLSGEHLVPDPHNPPPPESSAEAVRRHTIFANLMNRYRLLLLLRKAIQDGVNQELEKYGLASANRRQKYNPMDAWF